MEGTRTAATPPQFEHAITLARLAGAFVVALVAPFLPNLGPGFIALVSGTLVVSAAALHLLSTRVRDVRRNARLSWAAFLFDTLIALLAILMLTPDPLWPIVPLMAVLLIITSTFRLGARGAVVSTVLMGGGLLGIALWRERVLGLGAPVAYVAFDLIIYCLTAVVVISMLREVGVLRRERLVLMVRANDADRLRESAREHATALEQERHARTAAELAMTRLDAVQRIADIVLRHASEEELLPETLRTLAQIVGARSAAILSRTPNGFAARAGFGFVHLPRAPLAARGDTEGALRTAEPTAVHDDSTVPLDALVPVPIVSRLLLRIGDDTRADLLYLGFDRVQELTAEDGVLLRSMAERLGTAIARADRLAAERRARAAAERTAARAQLLVEVDDALRAAPDAETGLERVARLLAPRVADECVIVLLRADGRVERVASAAATAEREAQLATVTHRPLPAVERGGVWKVIHTKSPLFVEHAGPDDLAALAHGPEHLRALIERDVRSWCVVPILGERDVLGALVLAVSGSRRALTSEDLTTVQAIAARVASATQRLGATMSP